MHLHNIASAATKHREEYLATGGDIEPEHFSFSCDKCVMQDGSAGLVSRFSMEMGLSFMLMRCEGIPRQEGEILAINFHLLVLTPSGA